MLATLCILTIVLVVFRYVLNVTERDEEAIKDRIDAKAYKDFRRWKGEE